MLDVFFLKYLTIVVKIRIVVVTRTRSGDRRDSGLERMAITSFFPYLLYTLLWSSNASPLQAFFSVMFFFKHCDKFLFSKCIKIEKTSSMRSRCFNTTVDKSI